MFPSLGIGAGSVYYCYSNRCFHQWVLVLGAYTIAIATGVFIIGYWCWERILFAIATGVSIIGYWCWERILFAIATGVSIIGYWYWERILLL